MSKKFHSETKIQSRLQCVANGDSLVNTIRAGRTGAVRQRAENFLMESQTADIALSDESTTLFGDVFSGTKRRKSIQKFAEDIEVNVFVLFDREAPHFQADEAEKVHRLITRRRGRVGTATVKLADLDELSSISAVQSIELAETLKVPQPELGDVEDASSAAPVLERLNSQKLTDTKKKKIGEIGENILIGIIDVQGFDFAHPDFVKNKKTRFDRIWDQGGDAFQPPKLPVDEAGKEIKRAYGSEITADDLNFAINEASKIGATPYDLAPQSQMARGSHATHVASIAAGGSGVCRHAKIVGVLVSLHEDDMERRKSFYDTTRIVDAIDYLFRYADETGGIDAISINISLGTNGGAHDGSEMMSRWIDNAISSPGRVVCVAAGNSGQEAPRFAGDYGHYTGRIHAAGRVAANGLRADLEWNVVGNGIEDISENEIEIWYGAADEFAITLQTPDGDRIGPIEPGEKIENLFLKNRTILSIYNELSDPSNGDNKISVYLSPYFGEQVVGVASGSWKVLLTGRVVRNGRFHAWIERDDAQPLDPKKSALWRLPSFFGEQTYVDNASVSSLACGPRIIGVANVNAEEERINISSSQGPTRDGRLKPDIAAPGTQIVAARGFDPDQQWMRMTGTSMASPYVTGVAGLMLSVDPTLTAAQINGIIQRTSRPLPNSGYEWRDDAGYGTIDAEACVHEVARLKAAVKNRTKEFKQ